MVISSRTPEGQPGSCPICGVDLKVEPSDPPGDAPCPRCGHLVWFTADRTEDSTVIHLMGRTLRSAEIRRFADSIEERLTGSIVFDFERVEYLASATLGALIDLKKRLSVRRGGLILHGLHPDIREVFRITRLDQVFRIEDSS